MGVAVIIFFVLFLIRTNYTFLIDYMVRNRKVKGKTIYDVPVTDVQVRRERFKPMIGYFVDFLLMTLFVYVGVLTISKNTPIEYLVLLLAHIFLVEPLYYWYHRLLHVGRLYKEHHLYHHKSTVATPHTSFTFTLFERVTYTILFSIPVVVASLFGVLSFSGIVSYSIIFDFLNMVGHTNVEFFPKWYSKSWFSKLLYTPTFHSQHHSKFKKNFSLYMPIYDVIFKTYEPYTDAIFEQASDYRPLKKLSQKPDVLVNSKG
jgi:aldehyde decarbonylase